MFFFHRAHSESLEFLVFRFSARGGRVSISVSVDPFERAGQTRTVTKVRRRKSIVPLGRAGCADRPIHPPRVRSLLAWATSHSAHEPPRLPAAHRVPLASLMPWNVNFGPLTIGDKGVDVRPKMDFGIEYGNFSINAGVGDVRDSLSLGVDANVNQRFRASGWGLKEFLHNLKAQDGIADEYINPLLEESNKIVAEVLRLIDMDIRGAHIDGVMKVESGIGIHGSASLGWQDTEGYHMVGAGGKVRCFYPIDADTACSRELSNMLVVLVRRSLLVYT